MLTLANWTWLPRHPPGFRHLRCADLSGTTLCPDTFRPWRRLEVGRSKTDISILQDWTNNGRSQLPTANHLIADALRAAQAATGVHLDILGIDACIMATLEAVYEFRDSAALMVSSQDLVQGRAADYNDLFGRLTANPRMSAEEFAATMVASYRAFVESSAYGYGDQTITALRLGEPIAAVARAADALAASLTASMADTATQPATLAAITTAPAKCPGARYRL